MAAPKSMGTRLPAFIQAALHTTSDLHPVVYVPLTSILIDERDEIILPGNVRVPHAKGHGYQRDPYERHGWIASRAKKFREDLFRPIEVSVRDAPIKYELDGETYEAWLAAIDGGGRVRMREIKAELDEMPIKDVRVPVRLHFNLTRDREAAKFVDFDQEAYHLRQAQKFVAMLGAEHPLAVSIDKMMKPFYVATAGKGALTCVSTLIDIYQSGEATYYTHFLRDTAKAAAKWVGYDKGKWASRSKLTGIQFGAIGLVLVGVTEYTDDVALALTEILSDKRYAPAKMQAKAESAPGAEKMKPTVAEKSRTIAGSIARTLNKRIENAVDFSAMNSSDLWERFDARGSFAAKVRDWNKVNGYAADDETEDEAEAEAA